MLGSFARFVPLWLVMLGLGGCSSDSGFTTDVAGDYTVAITNGSSSCNFSDWQEGKGTSGIELTLTQDGSNVHGTLGGVTGAFFSLVFGSAEFDGTIHGRSFELENFGSRPSTSGNCVFTYDSKVEGTQSGDSISGTITYSTQTNQNPDCDAAECAASQRFSGSRPPK